MHFQFCKHVTLFCDAFLQQTRDISIPKHERVIQIQINLPLARCSLPRTCQEYLHQTKHRYFPGFIPDTA